MILVNKNYFEFLYIIGRGGFGKVWKVKLKKTNEFFAIKEMSKTKIIDHRSEISIMSERTLLSKLNNPFIVNMYFAFQDFSNLYLVMDLLSGGDLRYQLSKKKRFSEKETKFFISNIILALEYIHSKNIIHRDIKPENLVLELNGYLRVTDFGVAKINERDNSNETSGTPGYMAPEVILVQNHSFPSDFFALGVIGYEFMLGHRPYLGRTRKEIRQLIMYKQARINESDIPYSWSLESADFINKLLIRRPNKRLGYNGIKELKSHIWMKDINWNVLKRKELPAPFLPNHNKENFDKNYCENIENVGRATLARYKEYKKSDLFLDAFNGYTYINFAYLKTKYKRYKSKEAIDKKVNNSENGTTEKKIKSIMSKKQNSQMKKNINSMNIADIMCISFEEDKKFINSKSQRFSFDIKLYSKHKSTKNSKNNRVNFDIKKEVLKRRTIDNSINSAKNRMKNLTNISRFTMNKEYKSNSNKNRDKKRLRYKALKISEKLKELEKMRLEHESYINKEHDKKKINKSNSMKILNLNIGVNMSNNIDKLKTSKNRNELGTKNSNSTKTINKKNFVFNKKHKIKKPTRTRSAFERRASPERINNSKPKILVDKNNKINSLMLSQYNDTKREEKQKIENNNNINNESNEKNMKKNNDNKLLNNIEEVKNLVKENINKPKNQNILNDFNIKEFEKGNYNEPRSKIMFWIQKSLPINLFENNNNNFNNLKKDDKIVIIKHKDINEKINSQNNKVEKIPHYQLPLRHSVNEKNNSINKKRLEIINIINKNKREGKNKTNRQSKIINSSNQKNNYKTTKQDTKEKYNIKKLMNRKLYKSSERAKKRIKQHMQIEKSKSSLKSKSPKNTFLVFNTININIGDNQKSQKQAQTPNNHEKKNINSSLKDNFLGNNFFLDSISSLLRK